MANTAKEAFQAATDVVWALANQKGTTVKHSAEPYIDVIAQMYPGINYYSLTGLYSVINKFVSADVNKAHPELKDFATDTDAIAALGPTIELQEIKQCDGYAWEDWKSGPQL